MEKIHILYGFDNPRVIIGIENKLKELGYSVESVCKYTKLSISEFLKENTEFNTCVLIERLEVSGDSFTDKELTALTDYRDINVIIVLDDSRKGTDYVKNLYAAGITSALYQTRDGGAPVWKLVELILNKRARRKARTFYGLDNTLIETDYITEWQFNDYVSYLTKESGTLGEKYISLVPQMTRNQNIDFLNKVPKQILEKLMKTEEFYSAQSFIDNTGGREKVVLVPKKYELALPMDDSLVFKKSNFITRWLMKKGQAKSDSKLQKEQKNKEKQLKKEQKQNNKQPKTKKNRKLNNVQSNFEEDYSEINSPRNWNYDNEFDNVIDVDSNVFDKYNDEKFFNVEEDENIIEVAPKKTFEIRTVKSNEPVDINQRNNDFLTQLDKFLA